MKKIKASGVFGRTPDSDINWREGEGRKRIKLAGNPSRKVVEKRLDKLISEIVRRRGRCEKCGTPGTDRILQCAHIISRRNKGTRWLPQNCLCLCKGCHLYFAHQYPIQFAEFVKEKIGEKDYNKIIYLANKPTKFTVNELLLVEGELKKIGGEDE